MSEHTPDVEIEAWRTRLSDPQVRVLDTIEQDRALGGDRCEACGHVKAEHRDRMFVGAGSIDHHWCFTCHHVLAYLGEMTREQAHHAFEREAEKDAIR